MDFNFTWESKSHGSHSTSSERPVFVGKETWAQDTKVKLCRLRASCSCSWNSRHGMLVLLVVWDLGGVEQYAIMAKKLLRPEDTHFQSRRAITHLLHEVFDLTLDGFRLIPTEKNQRVDFLNCLSGLPPQPMFRVPHYFNLSRVQNHVAIARCF